ncbi:glycosyltransferase family A protein [Zhongshania aliphaticivorans]|uniref:glycosyltransferase family A protein n=1 Tax=Zhongshania aliphaticivorans TaxID=1470434 RepID=UPI00132FD823|nr:glycosyltransferase family 2 protein [Zhongshania aliphaticivorans]
MISINIALCTCMRPTLLSKCLDSLAAMAIPENSKVFVTVVENDENQTARPVVEAMQENFPLPLKYVVESKRGIPLARNRAIAEAHSLHADYLIFIDDDEWVDKDWLVLLLAYALSVGGKAVISGAVKSALPADTPEFMKEIFRDKGRKTGAVLSSCATNNVLIPIFVTKEMGLRFDESRPLAGGTDTLFFCEAVNRGVLIYKCAEAFVSEDIPASRVSLRWLSKRKYRVGITLAWRKRRNGRSTAGIVISSLAQIVVNSLIAVVAILLFQKTAVIKAIMKASRAAGTVSGVFGVEVDSYRTIDNG